MVGFPLLLIPLAIYNIIVFLMPGVSFTDPLVKLTLMSGAEWTVTLSDVLLTLGILLLLAEVIKGARPGAKYLTDHLLSLIVFGAAAAAVAESVLLDHPEPKPVQPAVAPDAASVVPEVASPAAAPKMPSTEASSPEIPSPGLQPGSGSPPSPDKPDTPQR